MKNLVPPKLEQFPAAKQRRLDILLEKNREGTITSKEKTRLEQLVAEAEQLMVANAKRLAEFSHIGGLWNASVIPSHEREGSKM